MPDIENSIPPHAEYAPWETLACPVVTGVLTGCIFAVLGALERLVGVDHGLGPCFALGFVIGLVAGAIALITETPAFGSLEGQGRSR